MKYGQSSCQQQQRLVLEKNPICARLTIRRFLLGTARCCEIDGIRRDRQYAGDRYSSEQGGKQDHREIAELPTEIARYGRTDHVASVIEGLIPSVLAIEALLTDKPERNTCYSGNDGRAGDRGSDLRDRYHPEILRDENER